MTFKQLDRLARVKRYSTCTTGQDTCAITKVMVQYEDGLISVTSDSKISEVLENERNKIRPVIWFALDFLFVRVDSSRKVPTSTSCSNVVTSESRTGNENDRTLSERSTSFRSDRQILHNLALSGKENNVHPNILPRADTKVSGKQEAVTFRNPLLVRGQSISSSADLGPIKKTSKFSGNFIVGHHASCMVP